MSIPQEEFLKLGGTEQPDIQAVPNTPGSDDGHVVSQDDFFAGKAGSIDVPADDVEKQGFLERYRKRLEERNQMGIAISDAVYSGEQSFAEGMLQIAGKVGAGAVLDLVGEGLVSAVRGISAITPDIIENPIKDATTAAAHMFLNTEIGQKGLNAAKAGFEAWHEFSKESPRAARNIEAVVNIGLLAAPVKTKPAGTTGQTVLGDVAEKAAQAAEKQVLRKKDEFVKDLILPKQTQAVKEAGVPRTTETGFGPFKKSIIEPTAKEAEIAQEVSKLDVGSNKTIQGNYNIIAKETENEAERLKAALQANDVPFPRKEFNARLKDVSEGLGQNPLIVGDAEKTAEKIIQKMQQLMEDKKSTASNLLEARKELDAWMKSQKGINIFDPKQEGAISIALREIRRATNDFIDMKATNVGVKESLKKQSNLYSAMENIAPKAADEANTAIMRTWKNIERAIPLRGEFNQSMAALFGLGGLGASAVFAPYFTGIALGSAGTFAMGKFLLSPSTKKGISLMLKTTDEAIRKATDTNLIMQLRADKAAMVELLKQSDGSTSEE